MNNFTIIAATVICGQLILASMLSSWKALFEMLALDCALALFYALAILMLA